MSQAALRQLGRTTTGKRSLETICVHGGRQHADCGRPAIPPITTATTFVQENVGEYGEFAYSRVKNPTRLAYETALAELEAGTHCAATASGMAAASLALDLLDANSHVVVMKGVYGGTHRLFQTVRTRTSGLEFAFVDLKTQLEGSLTADTKMVWLESPTNPLLHLVDIHDVCLRVKAFDSRILIVADNTFATAYNQRPLDLGCDLVMLSCSKYIGGHSDMLGGALITRNQELGEAICALNKSVGYVASPFDAYLALRGMKTLALRLERQAANALAVASALEASPKILTLQDEINLTGFFSALQIWVLAESLGGVESMINHCATMSHSGMADEERAAIGISDKTLRLSVGVENADDLIHDLIGALSFA